jgi:hypothetical protein
VTAVAVPQQVVLEGRDWVLLRIPRPSDPP